MKHVRHTTKTRARKMRSRRGHKSLIETIKWMAINCAIAANNACPRLTKTHHDIPSSKECIVATVAFNNPELVRIQFESLRKHMRANFNYIIYDNSTDPRASENLQSYSKQQEAIVYIKPRFKTIGRLSPSLDHGFALNCCSKMIAGHGKAARFALLLDHDIFLTKPWHPSEDLIPGIAFSAPKQSRGGITYFWPGLMIIDLNLVDIRLLSFLPDRGLDTGGRLGRITQKHRITTADIESSGYINTNCGTPMSSEDPLFDHSLMNNLIVVTYGPWIHLINGSGWRGKQNQNQSLDYIVSKIND